MLPCMQKQDDGVDYDGNPNFSQAPFSLDKSIRGQGSRRRLASGEEVIVANGSLARITLQVAVGLACIARSTCMQV